MGVTVIGTREKACFADNTSWQAFGPVHRVTIGDAKEELRAFRQWLGEDPRRIDAGELDLRYREWLEVIEEEAAEL